VTTDGTTESYRLPSRAITHLGLVQHFVDALLTSAPNLLPGEAVCVGLVNSRRAGQLPRIDVERRTSDQLEVVQKPDGDLTVRIRGTTSLMGRNDPMFVIDGMPVHATGFMGALTGISPHSIERIEILKSAESLAAYGSRGANGVVLITTKRAQ
jgi:TonB-dependent SusC/RagA subfamily outer membrane receptor